MADRNLDIFHIKIEVGYNKENYGDLYITKFLFYCLKESFSNSYSFSLTHF